MANQTITTNQTVEQIIALGLNDGDNITINNGAIVTQDRTPSKLIGYITINDGEYLITDPVVGSLNHLVGEHFSRIVVNGQGKLTTMGGWVSLGSTTGTDNQILTVGGTLGSYFGVNFVDVIAGIWIETGRRINYVLSSGTLPEIDDWIYIKGTKDPAGRIIEVNSAGGYIVVKFLIGFLVDGDALEVRKVTNNLGPLFDIVWTAISNGPDIKEAGIYQEFGNCVAAGISQMPKFGHGMGGFVFSHIHQANTLQLGGALGGYVPPAGCDIRTNNIHVSTSRLAEYTLGSNYHDGTNTENNMYFLQPVNGGEINFNNCNFGSFVISGINANSFNATFCSGIIEMGGRNVGSKVTLSNCVVCTDPIQAATITRYSFSLLDLQFGADVIDCLSIQSLNSTTYTGCETSDGVLIKNCIVSAANNLGYNSPLRIIRASNVVVDNTVVYADGLISYFPVVVSTSVNVSLKRFKLSHSQDETPSPHERSTFSIAANSDIFSLTGFEFLGSGTTGDKCVQVVDSTNITVRAVGMIDEPLLFNDADGEEFAFISGFCRNIEFSRCFKDGGNPEEFIRTFNTVKNVEVNNCGGNYLSRIEPIGVDNIQFKGYQAAGGSMGDYNAGIETDYPASYGSHIHDCFRSTTTGGIFVVFSPKTPQTATHYTVISGTPKFFKDGDLTMNTGDVIVYEMQYAARGHTAFTGIITTSRGGGVVVDGVDEWGPTYVQLDFQYDTGSGYNGTWLDLRTPLNLSGITGIVGGVRLKIRLSGLITQNYLNGLMVHTTTSISAQKANLYPVGVAPIKIMALTASNLTPITGARVYLAADVGGSLTAGTEIINTLTDVNGAVLKDDFVFDGDQPVVGVIRKGTTPPFFVSSKLSGVITSTGVELTGVMVQDE